MAHFIGTLRHRPRLTSLLIVGLFGVMLLLAFRDRGEPAEAWQSHVVQYERFMLQQSFAGRIVPGEQVEILSPAEAAISEMAFSFGDQVEEGQLLYRLDEGDLWRKRSEAEVSLLQAEDEAGRLARWLDGPEMRRAVRNLENVRLQSQDSQRRYDEGQRLFEKGLIARSEMDSLSSNLRQSQQAVEAAEEDLAQTRQRGVGVSRQVVMTKRDLAAAQYQAVAHGGAEIVSPRRGVIVRPSQKALTDDGLGIGAKVGRGQALGVVAAMDGLDVLFRVDEADLSLLRLGTPAVVTGPGFAGQRLSATLSAVAGEAETASSADKTWFAARVRLRDLPPQLEDGLRIGMTAQIALTLYETPRALTVPIEALQADGRSMQVRLADGRIEKRTLNLGQIGPNRAEVLSGLKAGDEVVWSH